MYNITILYCQPTSWFEASVLYKLGQQFMRGSGLAEYLDIHICKICNVTIILVYNIK